MSRCGSTIAAFRKVVKAQGWPHDNGDDPSFYAAQVWRPALVGNLPARRSQQTSAWRPGRVLLVSQIQGDWRLVPLRTWAARWPRKPCCRSEEHTSELQSRLHLVCRLLLEKK